MYVIWYTSSEKGAFACETSLDELLLGNGQRMDSNSKGQERLYMGIMPGTAKYLGLSRASIGKVMSQQLELCWLLL